MVTTEQLDILWILVAAALVLSMQIGFCLLETGLVRSKNSINVAIKNLSDLCASSIVFWMFGFGIMFGGSLGGWLGGDFFFMESESPWQLAFFVFQLVFCGTAITIISGAVAERMRFKSYLVIAFITSGLIYPLFGHWAWGGMIPGTEPGWLAEEGFIDFAGSTVVHSVGGWVALAAIVVIGPRFGHFDDPDRKIQGHDLSLSSAGVIILWFGWLGFNGGSTLAMNDQVPQIIANTILAGAFGGAAAVVASLLYYGMARAWAIMNGIIGGLVGITACCHVVSLPAAALVGFIAGIICFFGTQLLNKLHIDDAVGAVPAHAFCGIWGTLAVALVGNPASFGTGLGRTEQLIVQIQGVSVAFIWSFGTALIFFYGLGKIMKLRVSPEDELAGLNVSEHGASTELIDLITAMDQQERAGTFDKRIAVEPHTEVGQIAAEYNRVLDRIEQEFQKREIAAQEAEAAKQDAVRANQVKTDFLANMSHELRTPLGIITGYTEIIREELKDSGTLDHESDLKIIANASDHLLELINGVLDISKIESGQIQLYLEEIDLNPLMRSIVQTFKPLARENGNQLELEMPDGADPLVTDQTKLEQCLLNLLSNASKFTKNGQITLRVEKGKNADDRLCHRFIVTDTGIGISPQETRNIFEAFTQADSSTTRRYGGTGLGLAITRNFCELLGGRILVDSEVGFGSCFTLELPDTLKAQQQTLIYANPNPAVTES